MGAAVGHIASEEILNQTLNFGFLKIVIGFDGLATGRGGDDIFS